MDPREIAYDTCRYYLRDRKQHLSQEIYDTLSGWIRSRSFKLLAACTNLSPPALSGREGWRTLMQIEALFKKNKAFTDPAAAHEAAVASFERGEKLCRIANRRLDFYYRERDRLDPDLAFWLSRMEREVDLILGPFSPAEAKERDDSSNFLDELPRLVRFTSGATATRSRKEAQPHRKCSLKVACTSRAEPYITALSRWFGVSGVRFVNTEANRLEFVAKNWKTDRTIACEPDGNLPLQLACDTYIKSRLRKVRVDLSDQSLNQRLACLGSVDGSLATLDLSMASDTLCFNAVAWLLPSSWFRYLRDVRSPMTCIDGVNKRYAKFSSMGNGATFTLETLMFVAACRAVGSKAYSVYGDDIIIETELASKLERLLKFIGFHLNTDKSFTEGPFRESCGSNWYEGHDVTPVYFRELDKRKAFQCHFINTLASVAEPFGELWTYLRGLTADWELPFVPYNESTVSGVWLSPNWAHEMKLFKTRDSAGNKTWTLKFKAYTAKSQRGESRDRRGAFLWHLRAMGEPRVLGEVKMCFSTREASDPYDYRDGSGYSTPTHKFVRKWVYWRLPVVGAPDHLYWWSDFLCSSQEA
jgi:hypothetical protein